MKPPSGFPQQLSLAQMPGGEDFVKANKPTADHRYPRGFTPERLHEVAEAMPEENFEVGVDRVNGAQFSAAKGYFTEMPHRSSPAVPTKAQAEETAKVATSVMRARAVDVVARSTAPVEDVRGVKFIAEAKPSSTTLGQYWAPGLHPGRENPEVHLFPEQDVRAEGTLLHEIGHHADYRQDPRAFMREPGNPSPSLEGYAEGYMSGHHVPRPGNKEAFRNYDSRFAHEMNYLRRRKEASGGKVGYEKISGQPDRPLVGMLKKSMDEPPRPQPYQRQPYQTRLFERRVSSFYTSTELDYGQHPLESHAQPGPEGWEHDPNEVDTIKIGRGVPGLVSSQRGVPQRLRPEIKPSNYFKARDLFEHEDPHWRITDEPALRVARGEPLSGIEPSRNAHTHWR